MNNSFYRYVYGFSQWSRIFKLNNNLISSTGIHHERQSDLINLAFYRIFILFEQFLYKFLLCIFSLIKMLLMVYSAWEQNLGQFFYGLTYLFSEHN